MKEFLTVGAFKLSAVRLLEDAGIAGTIGVAVYPTVSVYRTFVLYSHWYSLVVFIALRFHSATFADACVADDHIH